LGIAIEAGNLENIRRNSRDPNARNCKIIGGEIMEEKTLGRDDIEESRTRREFLSNLGKWSAIVVTAIALGQEATQLHARDSKTIKRQPASETRDSSELERQPGVFVKRQPASETRDSSEFERQPPAQGRPQTDQ
jgi:hypothetical protein